MSALAAKAQQETIKSRTPAKKARIEHTSPESPLDNLTVLIDAPRGRRPVEKSADAFRSIGEAAAELGLKTHVLRFWETKFSQIRPMKRTDNRRFYRPEDMQALRVIQKLLHEDGMTIRGAKKYLASHSIETILQNESKPMTSSNIAAGKSVRDLQHAVREAVEGGAFRKMEKTDDSTERLGRLLTDLTDLKSRLDEVRKVS